MIFKGGFIIKQSTKVLKFYGLDPNEFICLYAGVDYFEYERKKDKKIFKLRR